jgi:transmembrane sensor
MSERERLDLPRLKLGWDDARTERLLASVHTRLGRRTRALRAAMVAGTLVSAICVAFVAVRWNRSSTSVATQSASARSSIRLREGSEIAMEPATSEVRLVEESPSRVRVEAVRGPARYSVVPNPDRAFEVRSGPVTVTVVGTEFVVEPRAEGAFVEVFRGKVRVSWGDEQAFVAAGESGVFPRPIGPSTAEEPPAARDENEPSAARGQASQTYRSRVARHDYRGAYAVLSHNPALAGDTVEDLLVAADVARLSDHPAEAVPYLQRILREHARDERAPMAAFTLGRTLSGLGRTREAMNMFGRVRASWPKSPLAEDALLRQAEAASELGDLGAARRFAEQYDRDYPSGRRRSEVRRFARLE